MTDDRKKKRKGSHWDATQRDLVGREHRRSSPFGVPIVVAAPEEDSDGTPSEDAGEEVTSPIDLLLRELSEEEVGVAAALEQRGLGESAAAQLAKVLCRVNAIKVDERAHNKARANQVLEVAGSPPADRLKKLEGRMRVVWTLLTLAGTAAVGSLITVGKGLYERGAEEGAMRYRLEVIDRDIRSLERDVRELRARGNRRDQPDRSGWLLPAPPKDSKP